MFSGPQSALVQWRRESELLSGYGLLTAFIEVLCVVVKIYFAIEEEIPDT